MIYQKLLSIVSAAPAANGLGMDGVFRRYSELAEQVTSLAAGFIEHGIEPGDVVALIVPNSPDIFVAAHALFAIGAIAMPLSPAATAAEMAAAGHKSGLRAVIAAPAHRAAAKALIAQVAPGALLLLTSDFAAIRTTSTAPLPVIEATATALYLFSSGSTGSPKIVPHTQAELLADGRRTSTAWAIQPDDRVLDILPPNFAMGFMLGVLDAFTAGASTIYWSSPLPLALSRKKLLETIAAEHITFMGAVPAMYEIIAGQGGDHDLSGIRAFSGGAALKRPVFDLVRGKLNLTLRQSYGSTEAIMVSHNDDPDPVATWASVGRPSGDAEVKLRPFATELGSDVGELMVRSSSLMSGYLGDPASNAEGFEDVWFRTGDLASLDDDGRIFIKGRSKLLIDVSGFKIDPVEVEDVLVELSAVAEAAVVGIADPRSTNRLRAYIVRNEDLAADRIIRHARERLSVQKIPAEIEFVDSLPRSPTGKLLRAQLNLPRAGR